jgi:class 3 adenylate cyclase
MNRIILIYDICSSTTIIENLKQNGKERLYSGLVEALIKITKKSFETSKYIIYKFLGDGFILIFEDDEKIDNILEGINYLVDQGSLEINSFIEKYIDVIVIKRGITVGLACGSIHLLQLQDINGDEYFGRAINLASRLQSSNENENSVLIQKEIYSRIEKPAFKMLCKETSRTFRNINNGAETKCYYYLPGVIAKNKSNSLMKVLEDSMKGTSDKKYNLLKKDYENIINEYFKMLKDNIADIKRSG